MFKDLNPRKFHDKSQEQNYMDYDFRIRNRDKLWLFINIELKLIFKRFNCTKGCRDMQTRINKLEEIYNAGDDKVNSSLNVSTLIKDNRTMKISMENIVLNSEIEKHI